MSQTAMNTSGAIRPQETMWAWLIKLATGPLLVILLVIHLIVNHYTGSAAGLMNYSDVVRYFQNPLIVGMEILFLITVITHSLLGVRSVLLDMHPSPRTLGVINIVLTVVGVGFVVYGIWLALTIAGSG